MKYVLIALRDDVTQSTIVGVSKSVKGIRKAVEKDYAAQQGRRRGKRRKAHFRDSDGAPCITVDGQEFLLPYDIEAWMVSD